MSWRSRRRKIEKQEKTAKERGLTRHHKKPKALNGDDSDRNISLISDEKHRAWHVIVASMDVYDIANEINKNFLDPDYMFVVYKRSDV
jgi:hypothetical protein